jgi:membrane protease subunit HflK
MKLHLRTFRWSVLPQRIRGMFNLNDPRWGRGDDKSANGEKPEPKFPG